MLEIDACALTHMGKVRTNNEDSVSFVRPSDKGPLATHGVLAVVADGMGGHEGGELASRIAADAIARSYYGSSAAPPRALEQAFHDASRAVFDTSRENPQLKGMGTTCVAAAIRGAEAWWAWIGDSRLYLVRDSRIYRMSEDHTLVQDMVRRGLMTAEEARNHRDRSVLERAMGTRERIEPGLGHEPIALVAGDRLLLCSDGLHDLIGDDDLARLAVGRPVVECGDALLHLALDCGGPDNISIVLVEARAESSTPRRTPGKTREHILG
ncbi:MAG TPA: PP2C family serine/threonine-protein phosphatase [Bryobacteraceae bacterium]|nr:PP2C family serine/threonine-protein phosphatase [Bryobacteraceae bacterium]